MTLYSEASGRKIVSTATAETVGKIDDFVLDPSTRSIRALTVKKTDNGDTLRWSDIIAFGEDAVTVTGADRIGAADEDVQRLTEKHHKVHGKLVLTTAGDELGKVKDVEFDPQSADLIALHLGDQQVAGVRLVGIGTYAVIVRADEQSGATRMVI